MKLLKALLLCWCCTNCVRAYFFYPLCSKTNDESCSNYFTLPDLSFLVEQDEQVDPDFQVQLFADKLLKTLNSIFSPVINYYHENLEPFIAEIHLFPKLREEKKVKTDSKLYFLFIMGTLTIYIVLYVYFTKKLFSFYQMNLRKQYVNNVRKIFKAKE